VWRHRAGVSGEWCRPQQVGVNPKPSPVGTRGAQVSGRVLDSRAYVVDASVGTRVEVDVQVVGHVPPPLDCLQGVRDVSGHCITGVNQASVDRSENGYLAVSTHRRYRCAMLRATL
jgi:hypothetical protein